MVEAYLKQPVQGEEGKFSVIRIEADNEEALKTSREAFLAHGMQDSSVEEYREQFRNRTAVIDSDADKALGDEPAPEATPEAPAAEEPKAEAPVEPEPTPEPEPAKEEPKVDPES